MSYTQQVNDLKETLENKLAEKVSSLKGEEVLCLLSETEPSHTLDSKEELFEIVDEFLDGEELENIYQDLPFARIYDRHGEPLEYKIVGFTKPKSKESEYRFILHSQFHNTETEIVEDFDVNIDLYILANVVDLI